MYHDLSFIVCDYFYAQQLIEKKNCRMDGKKYWQWLTGSLKEAVQAVREGRISVRRASIEFPVPRAIEST